MRSTPRTGFFESGPLLGSPSSPCCRASSSGSWQKRQRASYISLAPTAMRSIRRRGALAARSGTAANHANGGKFGHVFGDREKLRHRAEGLAAKIHVESRDDDSHSAIGEFLRDFDDGVVEKLGFVDSDDASVVVDEFQNIACLFDRTWTELCSRRGSGHDRRCSDYRSRGLKTWIFWRAICARFTRRSSSSVFPLNMLPQMTSIAPGAPGVP